MQKFGKCVVKTNIMMLALVILVLSENVGSLTVNVTRLEKNDKFSNPNRTAVSNCIAGGQSSHFDSCSSFRSVDTNGTCSDSKPCCPWCQCKDDHPVYMFHLGRCVNLQGLIADIFGQGSSGRLFCILTFFVNIHNMDFFLCSLGYCILNTTSE